MSYAEAVMRALKDSAGCNVLGVRVGIHGVGPDRVVVCDYDLAIDAGGSSRPLVFDYVNCPLAILSVEADNATLRDLGGEFGQRLFAVEPTHEWLNSRIRLSVELRWTEAEELGDCPFVVFPQFLPKPAQPTAITGQYLRAPMFLADDPGPPFKVLGIQRAVGPWDPQTVEQLQIAFIPRRWIAVDADDVVIAGPYETPIRAKAYRAAAKEIARIRQYIGEELGFAPTLRLAGLIFNNAQADSFPPGVILTGDEKFFGKGDAELVMLSMLGVRAAATAWWGAGIQLPGHYGAAVAAGIHHYLILQRFTREQRHAHLKFLLRQAREQPAVPPPPNVSAPEWSFNFSTRLGLALYEAQLSNGRVAETLGEMTRKLWATEPYPGDILAELRGVGIDVPTWPRHLEAE